MSKELIIDVRKDKIEIALLDTKSLVELKHESLTQNFAVGNVYLGRVKKIMSGLNAAFIDVGCEKEAFIHYHDLGPQFATLNGYVQQILNDRKHTPKLRRMPDLGKDGNISSVLTVGQMILVQVVKEPISTKGPRLAAEISIAGRNMVLLPLGDNKTSVSQKIKSAEERTRLRQLVHSIKPANCGVIVRTVAEGRRVAELDTEILMMHKRWELLLEHLKKAKGISLLLEESSRSVSIIRDLFSPDFAHIHVNNKSAYEELHAYVKMIAPERKDIVTLYDSEKPIFDHFGITKQIKSLFGRTVSFKRGAYLIMDQTEAMFVIDVNSGTRTKASQG
ncbi:MAG: ribonuclease E/G, partial [Prevotellaceae bacterium]|nr:ribonuclease E/G [Prevotellaceae bacterium]